MERYASTLATTVACVGLLVAGHLTIVHQRSTVPDKPVKGRVVAANAAAETPAWADPPAKPDPHPAATSTGTTAWTAAVVEPAQAAEPAVAALPAVQAPVQNAGMKPDVKSDKAKRAAEQARRKKLAQAKARRTQTAARDVPSDQTAIQDAAPQAPPPATRRVDPITDLLRGLGIGGQS